ncbi:MAG: TRAP transporter small permease [Rubrivivax sp.]|nr:TRAP transporter small permease [Rubrivivax sp.]
MRRLTTLLTGIAGIALFAMMVLTFADVFARKFLPNSIRGAVEVTELLMLVMIYVAMPLVSRAGEHIVFDLLDRVLPAAVLRWQQRLSHLLVALLFGGAGWLVWQRAERTASLGDITSALEIRLAPFHYVAAAMLALSALMHLWLSWRAGDVRPGGAEDRPR